MISVHEYYRKATHIFSLAIPISYWYLIPEKNSASIVLALLTLVFIFFDSLRLKSNFIKSFFAIFFNKMLKDHELKGGFTGATWVMISSTIVISVFSKNIAIISLLFLSIGDTVSGIFGKRFGRLKIGKKTFEGFIAGFSSCLLISYFYNPLSFYVSATGAFFGMLIETLPLPFDDNLKIPITSAVAMSLLIGLN
tara:strand:+ start:6174 stop:6758 length:585 start_codon:yes stop_codon:yes gene_type:complete